MATVLATPEVGGLAEVAAVLREWQDDRAPVQLHPGDLGWFWRFGARATAASVRTWNRGGVTLAVGLLDGPRLLRLAIAPDAWCDEELASQLVDDVARPERGVLPAGEATLETPTGAPIEALLLAQSWRLDEPWTALRRDLADAVDHPGARVEVVGAERVAERTSLQRASFDNSTFSDESWHAMATGPCYAEARCLLAYDGQERPVATVTVWSAGPGKPGLLEPMGVHRDHRRRGYGKAITIAAAAALRQLGASSAIVCTASSNIGAVATYTSAGFRPLPQRRDLRRDA